MDINWYGLSYFRIRESGTTVLCDPFDKSVGLTPPKVSAEIVTVSHDAAGHSAITKSMGTPKVLSGPGEYEINNVFIHGLTTYHSKENAEGSGEESSANENDGPERNVAFFFDFDGFTVAHLGDMGQVPKRSLIDDLDLGDLDILLVPVGGGDTLDPTHAVELVSMLEPKIVIPMHYQQPGLKPRLNNRLEPVDKFLKELGMAEPEPRSTLKISRSSLPEETQVVLLTSG